MTGLLGDFGDYLMAPSNPATPQTGLLGYSPFSPDQSSFRNSNFANLLRGALGGLAQARNSHGAVDAFAQGAMGGADAVEQRRQQLAQRAFQGQQYQAGQMSAVSNSINLSQQVIRINYIRSRMGLPQITQQDLIRDPSLANPSMTGSAPTQPSVAQVQTGAPIAGAMTPQQPQGPVANPGNPQPANGGAMPPAGQPQMTPQGVQSGMPAQVDPNDPYGTTQAVNDALMIDPKFGQVELNAALAQPGYLRDRALYDKGYERGPNGVWRNPDGAVASAAEMARATATATAQGQLPSELTKIAATGNQQRQTETLKAAQTPTKITIPDPANPGGYTEVNTNNLAASQGSRGVPVLTDMDKQLVPMLTTNVNDNAKAAGAARDSLTQLGELRKALVNLPTGPGSENINDAAAAMQKFGIDINQFLPQGWQSDPTKYAIAAKNFNNLGMALARSNFPGGRITNADLTLALKATPNFANNPQANQILLDNIEAVQRLKIDRSEFDADWLKGYNGVPRLQMEQDWADKVKGMKNVPDDIKSSFYSFGDLANNPQAPQTPTMQLPKDAVSSAVNQQTGHAIYLYKGPGGYFWGDENKKAVK